MAPLLTWNAGKEGVVSTPEPFRPADEDILASGLVSPHHSRSAARSSKVKPFRSSHSMWGFFLSRSYQFCRVSKEVMLCAEVAPAGANGENPCLF